MATSKDKNNLENTSQQKEAQNDHPPNCGGCFFEIHVKGQLDSRWSDWLYGLEMKLIENGEMILSGPIVDQAALMGVLNKLNRLNLTLVAVNKVDRKINKETK